jgi:hypothetical protein
MPVRMPAAGGDAVVVVAMPMRVVAVVEWRRC